MLLCNIGNYLIKRQSERDIIIIVFLKAQNLQQPVLFVERTYTGIPGLRWTLVSGSWALLWKQSSGWWALDAGLWTQGSRR